MHGYHQLVSLPTYKLVTKVVPGAQISNCLFNLPAVLATFCLICQLVIVVPGAQNGRTWNFVSKGYSP
jgi:hypothetical protein